MKKSGRFLTMLACFLTLCMALASCETDAPEEFFADDVFVDGISSISEAYENETTDGTLYRLTLILDAPAAPGSKVRITDARYLLEIINNSAVVNVSEGMVEGLTKSGKLTLKPFYTGAKAFVVLLVNNMIDSITGNIAVEGASAPVKPGTFRITTDYYVYFYVAPMLNMRVNEEQVKVRGGGSVVIPHVILLEGAMEFVGWHLEGTPFDTSINAPRSQPGDIFTPTKEYTQFTALGRLPADEHQPIGEPPSGR